MRCNLELMPEALATEIVPLVAGENGVILVAGTRVPLDSITASFQDGATAEEIAQQYPTVSLASVYQIIGYYLRHLTDVESYLARRELQRSAAQALNESRWPSDGMRERLLARRK